MSRVGIRLQRQDGPPTCDITSNSTSWMVNSEDKNPCELVERVMHTCPESSQSDVGRVHGDLRCPGDPQSACCCSVATYALLSACWVCQGHRHEDITSLITSSYSSFFEQCPGQTENNNTFTPEMRELKLPLWSMIQPADFSEKWDYDLAREKALSPISSITTESTVSTSYTQISSTTSESPMTSTPSVSSSTKSSVPAGTIAASVLGALAATALFCLSGCFLWRWRRRRRVIQAAQGTKVDLTEPDVHEASPPSITPRRTGTFPYPFESIVPRYHAGAQHSYNPSRSDEPETRPLPRPPPESVPTTSSRRFTAPSGDQLMRDLARLGGSPRKKSKSPWRRRASISTFTHSDYSGSSSSRRAPDGQGQYFHLPPSARYLAEVARYPENVDPDRPWNIRQ